MSAIDMHLEIELGVTGGEEDGVDNTDVDSSRLYTQPEEVAEAYEVLSAISPNFTIAAAFGNVHGVYKPGNVELRPGILNDCQSHIEKVFSTRSQPVDFVFHGGSGSSLEEIREAIGYGVVKMTSQACNGHFCLAFGNTSRPNKTTWPLKLATRWI